jgi:hypothetical protein
MLEAVGIDSLQAIVLAMRMAEARLHVIASRAGGTLSWGGDPDIGLS